MTTMTRFAPFLLFLLNPCCCLAFQLVNERVRSISCPSTVTSTSSGVGVHSSDDIDAHGDTPTSTGTNTKSSRRDLFLRSGVAAASAVLSLSAADLLNTQPASAADAGAAAFVGTYSDPINHPGGKRTIKLLESKVGDYQLAEVRGGGGIGEPKDYTLPAVIVGDRAIIIDFSPKGGPRDFSGVLEKDGSIKFLRDGNRWPRLE